MISRLRTGAKFFTVGLILGLLFAPRAGADVRERMRERILVLLPGGRSDT